MVNAFKSKDEPKKASALAENIMPNSNNKEEGVSNSEDDDESIAEPKASKLFAFDPNTIDSTTLVSFGIKAWKVKNFIHYRKAGKVFHSADDMLDTYGWTEEDIKPTYQSFADSAEALQDGQIDAAFIVAGAPTTAVTSLATTNNVYLVSLDDEHINALIEESPFYAKAVIPAETYKMPEDATTVAVSAVVIAADDVADADVYNFLFGVFENLDALAQIHDKANELSLEFASSFSGVPYHSGAVAYFADKGITVEGK